MPKAQRHCKLQCFGFWNPMKNVRKQPTSVQNGASLSSCTKRKCGTEFLELSPARLWPHLPKRAQIRATPPRLASLRFAYTYTQPRPSARFRNIYIYIYVSMSCKHSWQSCSTEVWLNNTCNIHIIYIYIYICIYNHVSIYNLFYIVYIHITHISKGIWITLGSAFTRSKC